MFEKSASVPPPKLKLFAILGPRDHQNRIRHVLKLPGKDLQGLGDHLVSIYDQKNIFEIFHEGILKVFPLYLMFLGVPRPRGYHHRIPRKIVHIFHILKP